MLTIIVGLLIGLALGLTGAGGSLLAVPLLTIIVGLPVADAMGLSLIAVFVSSVIGVALAARKILWRPAIIIAIAGMLTAPLGRWLSLYLAEAVLIVVFALLAVWIAVKMWVSQSRQQEKSYVRAQSFSLEDDSHWHCQFSQAGDMRLAWPCLQRLILGGVAIGFLSGLLGVGGGFLIVPLLLALSGIKMPQAVASSLFIIALVSLVGGTSNFLLATHWDVVQLLSLLAGSALGMLVAYALSHKFSGPWLQKVFSVLIVISAISMINRVL